jgi:hypothetical protein
MRWDTQTFRFTRLGHEISLVLILKLIALYILWALFFGPAHQVHPTPASVADKLFSTTPVSQPGASPHE